MKAAYRAFDAFCELPEEVRTKYERNESNYGYVKPGPSKYSLFETEFIIREFLFKLVNIFFVVYIHRYTDEKEARHVFNVTGREGPLPDEEVPGFKSAVDELARDFKQLSAMLLTVMSNFSVIYEHKK